MTKLGKFGEPADLRVMRRGGVLMVTHAGLVRERNEDCVDASGDGRTIALADGVGGRPRGYDASSVAVKAAVETSPTLPEILVQRAMLHAQRAVLGLARPGEGAPATTLVVARFCDHWRHVAIGWSGDSRAYQFDGVMLSRLTGDHRTLGDDGQPLPNVLSQALGGNLGGESRGEYVRGDLARGHSLLLASDGLHSFVDDDAIAAVLRATRSREEALRRLVSLTFEAGAPDNVTMALVRVS